MTYRSEFTSLSILIPVALVVVLGGCASARSPAPQIAAADIAVRKAESGGAEQYAALELYQAREKLDQAKAKANQKRTYDAARRLAEKACADAELADAKSRAAQAGKAAEEAHKTLEALHIESERDLSE